MKRGSTTFLKLVLILIAGLVLAGLLYFPQVEGRATNLDLFSIYADPFILYIYLASIPFFWALLQAGKLLSLIDQNKAFSTLSVKAFKQIKYCAGIIAVLLMGVLMPVFSFAQDDDAPGVVLIWLVLVFVSIVVSTFAAVLQKLIQNAVDLKEENDLTV